MRISDWSSDVCSSDLALFKDTPLLSAIAVAELVQTAKNLGSDTFRYNEPMTIVGLIFLVMSLVSAVGIRWLERRLNRSEERRVGKECVSTCRSRWSPFN